MDPLTRNYVPKEKIESDLQVMRSMIWYVVIGDSREVAVPPLLPGWTVVTNQTFSVNYGFSLPPQEGGCDCGMFVVMYFFLYIPRCKI